MFNPEKVNIYQLSILKGEGMYFIGILILTYTKTCIQYNKPFMCGGLTYEMQRGSKKF